MSKKNVSLFLSFFMILSVFSTPAHAVGLKEASSSLLLPPSGQVMNGEYGTTKSKIMAGVEVAAVTTVVILGLATGGGVVWAGLGPLLANHLWSATDAYKSANRNYQNPAYQQQLADAQRNIEYSRDQRFQREDQRYSSIRDRIQRAGEEAARRS